MSRAFTVKINRMEAIRLVGAAIRTKTQEFEQAKKIAPAQLEKTRSIVLKAAEKRVKAILQADSIADLTELCQDVIPWQGRKDFPDVPQLSVCSLKAFLLVLQNDMRKTIPLRSDHELWAILQGKCEVIR